MSKRSSDEVDGVVEDKPVVLLTELVILKELTTADQRKNELKAHGCFDVGFINRSNKQFQLMLLMDLVSKGAPFKTAGMPKKQKVSKAAVGGGATKATPIITSATKAPAAAKTFMTMKDVLSKHGFHRQPKCKCFKSYCKTARLQDVDKILGTKCIDAQKYDTGMLETDEEEQMTVAKYMQQTEEEESSVYFSWCEKVFFCTEFGYDHRGARGCYKQSCF